MTDFPLPSLLGASATTPSATGAVESERSVAAGDFETFLTLLTAQLRNQDPLQPLDSTEFVSQLASFSTVEQVIGSNERLDQLIAATAEQETAGLASWLGTEAADRDGRIRAGEAPVDFSVPEEPGAAKTEIVILDAAGNERRVLNAQPGERAEIDPIALGAAADGETLRIVLRYSTTEAVLRETPATIFGRITEVTADQDGPVLRREDGLSLRPSAITALSTPM
ncbi:MAG: flagellar hook capping FlgD N-terminal domain-containing protein [Pseudomonadota bacterium]